MLEADLLSVLIPDRIGAELRSARQLAKALDAVASKQGQSGRVRVFELALLIANGDRLCERVEERPAPLDPLF